MDEQNNQAPQGEAPEKTVPYSRFEAVVASKNEALAQLQSLQIENQSLLEKAATVDTLGSQLREAQAQAQAAEQKFGRWQSIASQLGTTDQEAIEAAEWAHSRLPQKDRPKLNDWLTGIKADPATAPKVLQPWLSPGDQGQAGAAPTPRPTPRPPATGTQPPGAPSSLSNAELRRIREEAQRTGDWSRWRELRKSFTKG
ncbi:MAG: hypothetical protein H6739_29380 [Alphaproteobacteria bacterium]|nr:hypothetical protein [Alphaproteobacteria bacterium]